MNNLYTWAMRKRASATPGDEVDAFNGTSQTQAPPTPQPQQQPMQQGQQQAFGFDSLQIPIVNLFTRVLPYNRNDNQLADIPFYPGATSDVYANETWLGNPGYVSLLDVIARLLGGKNYVSLPPDKQKWVRLGGYTVANNWGDQLGLLNSGNLYTNMQQGVLRSRGRGGKGFDPAQTLEEARALTNTAQQLYYDPRYGLQNMDPQLYASWAADYATRLDPKEREAALVSGGKTLTELSHIFGVYNYHDLKEIAKTLGYPDLGDPKQAQKVMENLNYTKQFAQRFGRSMQDVLQEQGTLAYYLQGTTGVTPDVNTIRQLQYVGALADMKREKTGHGATREEAIAEALQDISGYQDPRGNAYATLLAYRDNPNWTINRKLRGGRGMREVAQTPALRAALEKWIRRIERAPDRHTQRVALARAFEFARDNGLLDDRYTTRDAGALYGLRVAGIRGRRPEYLNPLPTAEV